MFAVKIAALAAALLAINVGCSPRPGHSARSSSIRFRDVTQESGITFSRTNGAFGKRWMPETMGGGGAFLDYDADGFLDVLLVNGDWWPGHPLSGPRPTLKLFRNDGTGRFQDVTVETGLDISLQGMGAAVGDYDNDGYDDLYITGVGGNRLFHNIAGLAGKRRFADVTRSAGVDDSGWSTSAAWLDYDLDGRLDLFVCHYVKWSPETDLYCGTSFKAYCTPQEYRGESSRLFRNGGGGRFADVTREAGLFDPNGKSLGVRVHDVDGDRYPDILVANDTEPNFYYRNQRNGRFREEAEERGIAVDPNGRARAGMGIDVASTRNDGAPLLAIGNFNVEGAALWRRTTDSFWEEITRESGAFNATFPYVTFGLVFGDWDNDGFADLGMANGHVQDTISRSNPGQSYKQPALILRNRGDGTYEDVSASVGSGITEPMVGRGVCRGDYDNDGAVDLLIVANRGAPRLLRNETRSANHWLTIRLVGTKANRSGYGAQVRINADGVEQAAYTHSGSSYLSASDRRLHFGLGASKRVERIRVNWPSGQEQTWGPLDANRIITLVEGRSEEGPTPAP